MLIYNQNCLFKRQVAISKGPHYCAQSIGNMKMTGIELLSNAFCPKPGQIMLNN